MERSASASRSEPGFLAGERWRAPLLLAGALSFVLYVSMDVAASLSYDGYSYMDHTISELSAIGAPTRTFWLILSVPYQALVFAFAAGVLVAAGRNHRLRLVGWLLLAVAANGLLWWIAPMHRREILAADGGTWQDTMHLVLAGTSTLLFFATIGVGSFALGRTFQWYSLVTIAVMLVFGGLMNMDVAEVSKDGPTPYLGVYERLAVESAMLWQAVLAVVLLRREGV